MSGFAVIYDVREDDGEDREEYWEVFDTAKDAEEMFNRAYGGDARVHNARVVLILRTIKEQLDD